MPTAGACGMAGSEPAPGEGARTECAQEPDPRVPVGSPGNFVVRIVDRDTPRRSQLTRLAIRDEQIVGVRGTSTLLDHGSPRSESPDVIVLGVGRLDGRDGKTLAGARRRWPQAGVIVVAHEVTEQGLVSAVAAGVAAVMRFRRLNELGLAVQIAAGGGLYVDSDLSSMATDLAFLHRGIAADPHGLTRQEFRVLRNVCRGASNREIADSFGLSIHTIKSHVRQILKKLDVADRRQAADLARRRGWFTQVGLDQSRS